MTKKLVSFDDQAEPGQGLPAAVKAELNDTYGTKVEVQEVADAVEAVPAPPVPNGALVGLSLISDSTGRGVYRGDGDPGIGGNGITAMGMTWLTWLTRFSQGALLRGVNASVIGDTIAQMDARLQTDVLNNPTRRGSAVAVCSGYNDTTANVSVADYMASFASIHAKLKAAQLEMIACTPLPTANSPDKNVRMGEYSDAIRAYAKKHGLFLLDLRALTMHTDGGLIPSVKSDGDGVHPGNSGQYELGKIVFNQLKGRIASGIPSPVDTWGARGNLTPNRTFTGEPVGGVATPLFRTTTAVPEVVPSVITGDSRIEGNWQRFTHTNSTAEATYVIRVTDAASKVSPGDVLALTARISVEGRLRARIGIQWGVAPYGQNGFNSVDVNLDNQSMYGEFVVPAAFTNSNIDLQLFSGANGVTNNGWVQVSQLGLYNLTRLNRVF